MTGISVVRDQEMAFRRFGINDKNHDGMLGNWAAWGGGTKIAKHCLNGSGTIFDLDRFDKNANAMVAS